MHRVCVHTYVCVYLCVSVCTYVCMRMHVSVCMYVCMRMHVSVCMYVCVYIYLDLDSMAHLFRGSLQPMATTLGTLYVICAYVCTYNMCVCNFVCMVLCTLFIFAIAPGNNQHWRVYHCRTCHKQSTISMYVIHTHAVQVCSCRSPFAKLLGAGHSRNIHPVKICTYTVGTVCLSGMPPAWGS